jgi:hypothetical protein
MKLEGMLNLRSAKQFRHSIWDMHASVTWSPGHLTLKFGSHAAHQMPIGAEEQELTQKEKSLRIL